MIPALWKSDRTSKYEPFLALAPQKLGFLKSIKSKQTDSCSLSRSPDPPPKRFRSGLDASHKNLRSSNSKVTSSRKWSERDKESSMCAKACSASLPLGFKTLNEDAPPSNSINSKLSQSTKPIHKTEMEPEPLREPSSILPPKTGKYTTYEPSSDLSHSCAALHSDSLRTLKTCPASTHASLVLLLSQNNRAEHPM